MKISSRTHYGLNAMVDLAIYYGDEPVFLKDIAKRIQVSSSYLEQTMTLLVLSGLVESRRGRQGGFRLAEEPGRIHLSRIIKVLEGSLSLSNCVDNPGNCKWSSICVARDVWVILKEAMSAALGSITLQNLAEEQKRKLKKR